MKSRERMLDEHIERQKQEIARLEGQNAGREALLRLIYQAIEIHLKGGDSVEEAEEETEEDLGDREGSGAGEEPGLST